MTNEANEYNIRKKLEKAWAKFWMASPDGGLPQMLWCTERINGSMSTSLKILKPTVL